MRRVGFWKPVVSDSPPSTNILAMFLTALESLEGNGLDDVNDFIDPAWDARERESVLRYVTDWKYRGESCTGWSTCRCCGKSNGSADFGDGVYVWPEGFGHYIAEHCVRPPKEFVDHVLRRAGQR